MECVDRAAGSQQCSTSLPVAPRLQQHRVGHVPHIYYIPEYLGAEEEESLVATIKASKQRWTQVRRTRNNLCSVITPAAPHLPEAPAGVWEVPSELWGPGT